LLKYSDKTNAVFIDTNKIYSLSNLLIRKDRDSLKVFRPVKYSNKIRIDTISLSSKPIDVFASVNNEVAYLNNDLDLVFDSITKFNNGEPQATYKIKKIANLYNLKNNLMKPLLMEKTGRKVSIISADTVITYYSSFNFSSRQISPFLFMNGDSKNLIIYNPSDSSFRKAELREGKSYLRFRKVFTKENISNFEAAHVGDKDYIIYYDKAINSLVFQNIL
jgi:hypothetical protein